MTRLATSVGLISGIDIAGVVDSLISAQRAPAVRMEQRAKGFQAVEDGLSTLEANLLSLSTAIGWLDLESTFNSFAADNSDTTQIRATTNSDAVEGTYQFQAIRSATTHEVISKGFANTLQQTMGTGTLTIATGGQLEQPTLLSSLNGGNGIRRGVVRITDRSGQSADVNLANAYTLNDVLDAINNSTGISVVAGTADDRIVLTDTTGSTAFDLSVVDLSGSHAAEDLGIGKTIAASTLSGNAIYSVTGDFTLTQINDGNTVRLLEAAGDTDADIQITLSDATVLAIDLDGAATLNDVINRVNNHADNGGKVSSALVNGHLELTDLTGGSGTFSVEDANGASVVHQLGLDAAAVGGQITGTRLLAGLNSVLLRNLRGGQGILQTGQITLTDRSGTTATIDLTGVESLGEVINAVNAAEDAGGTKLQLSARINDTGTGIVIRDTSAATASNVIIADEAGSTLAAQLGIAVDAAVDSIDSGSLNLRTVNEATQIDNYAPDGGGIANGSFVMTNSNAEQVTVSISSLVSNLGDVIQRINAATSAVAGFNVRAQLNETGDGFVLIDSSGGSGALQVQESGSTTAADLRILGTGVDPGDGTSRISSRLATIVEVQATDTLDDLVQKINAAGAFVTAGTFDDGSAFNSKRLSLTATTSGDAGRLVIDDGGLGLGFSTQVLGQDALLRVGRNVETGFLVSSGTDNFDSVVTGLDVEIRSPGDQIAEVTVSRNTGRIQETLTSFIDGYNAFLDNAAALTKFDSETNKRGVLQGEGIVLRIRSRLDSLINRQSLSPDDSVRSLADLGVRIGLGGKLSLDSNQLTTALAENPQAVADFFLQDAAGDPADFGFAQLAKQTLDSFTDPFTGSLALEKNALQESVDSLTARIEHLDEILLVRRERLLREFTNMENALGALSSQQQAISVISPLAMNAIGKGIS